MKTILILKEGISIIVEYWISIVNIVHFNNNCLCRRWGNFNNNFRGAVWCCTIHSYRHIRSCYWTTFTSCVVPLLAVYTMDYHSNLASMLKRNVLWRHTIDRPRVTVRSVQRDIIVQLCKNDCVNHCRIEKFQTCNPFSAVINIFLL